MDSPQKFPAFSPPVRSDQIRHVAVPAGVFVDNNQQLVVSVYSVISSFTLTVFGRVVLEDGSIWKFQSALAIQVGGTVSKTTVPLRSGYLIQLGVYNSAAGQPQRGSLYITADITEQMPDNTTLQLSLLRGYMTTRAGLIWQGGRQVDSVEGPGIITAPSTGNPAAGAEFTTTVGASYRQRLIGLGFQLATSGTANTRRVHLQITDGSNVLYDIPSNTTQAQSLTYKYYWANFAYSIGLIGTTVLNPLPANIVLAPGYQVKTSTDLIDAGDQYSAIRYHVEQWIEGA